MAALDVSPRPRRVGSSPMKRGGHIIEFPVGNKKGGGFWLKDVT
jgi:hypothetical protein